MKTITETGHREAWLLWLLRAGTALVFAGYAWRHLYWDVPYGVLLWNPVVYEFLHARGMDWNRFAGDGQSEGIVRNLVVAAGWVHAALAVVALSARRRSWIQLSCLVIGAVMLCVLAYCQYVQALRVPAMWLEYGGQFLMPVLLVLALRLGLKSAILQWVAVLAIIMTFAGHGAYAAGWVPTPGHFQGMTVVILGVSPETAASIIHIAGLIDFVVCGAILVPSLRRSAALYAAVWGGLTALARPMAGMKMNLLWWGADQFIHEAVVRVPHFVIPLFLFLRWRPDRVATAVVEEGRVPDGSADSGPQEEASNHIEETFADARQG